MHLIILQPIDLVLAASLLICLALLTLPLKLKLFGAILISGARMVVQLTLVGLVLKAVFAHVNLIWLILLATFMLAVAGREVIARQERPLLGLWGYGVGTVAMFISSFTMTLFALIVILGPEPWYSPQYAIPLLGMMLGNAMNGVAVGLDRLTQSVWDQRGTIEARLIMGHTWQQAITDVRRRAARSGMTPAINSMAAAGVVSLPGMMTGQILAGAPPVEAVNYQILVIFLIAAGSGFGTIGALWFASRRLFDERSRLRLDRLSASR